MRSARSSRSPRSGVPTCRRRTSSRARRQRRCREVATAATTDAATPTLALTAAGSADPEGTSRASFSDRRVCLRALFFTISGVSIEEGRHFRSRVCSQALFHCLHDISDAPSCSIRQGHEQSSPGSVIRYTYMPTVSERLARSPAFPDAAKPSRWIGLRDIGLRGTDMRDRAEISLRPCSKLRALAGLGPVTSSDVRKIVR
jgi:hypothetical protein